MRILQIQGSKHRSPSNIRLLKNLDPLLNLPF